MGPHCPRVALRVYVTRTAQRWKCAWLADPRSPFRLRLLCLPAHPGIVHDLLKRRSPRPAVLSATWEWVVFAAVNEIRVRRYSTCAVSSSIAACASPDSALPTVFRSRSYRSLARATACGLASVDGSGMHVRMVLLRVSR